MESWRDNISAKTQRDVEALFDNAVDASMQFLKKERCFCPFVFRLSKNDEIIIEGTYLEGDPTPDDIISELKQSLMGSRAEIKAAAVISQVKIIGGGEAVRISVEHVDGLSVEFIVPYFFKGVLKKEVKFKMDEAATFKTDRFIWADI